MQNWVKEELQYANLGDARLNKRLIRLVNDLSEQPTATIPEACGSASATKAAYRFFASSNVVPDDIRDAHQRATVERIKKYDTVLVIQDTTDLDFTNYPWIEGLGYLNIVSQLGLKVHSAFAVSSDGVPLGLIHQEVWSREIENIGKRHTIRQRETKDKESQKWLSAFSNTQETIPEGIRVITVADREADIYDLFAMPRKDNHHLLIRATHNRRVKEEARYLWDAIKNQEPAKEKIVFTLQRKDDRPEREVVLTIRWTSVEIMPPRHHLKRETLQPVKVWVILAEEENPPASVEPVKWLLITTIPITTFEDVVQCIKWYSYRWLIERYHFVLKSGCRVEELQLESADRIQRALATYCIVAWRLLWLTYEARKNPFLPCTVALETHEWQALYCTIHKTSIPLATPPTLKQAVLWIAQLGGFLGRKSDGNPGVKTIWRGFRRLHDIANTWKLINSSPPLPATQKTYG
jgi:hypothetical protein